MKIDIPSHLSDDDLVSQVKFLARYERDATATLIAHLAELDARRLYLAAGFSSLFAYCCEVLRLSEPAAYNRIEAARAARRFPVILPMLGEGSLSLATVRLLASNLTAENQQERSRRPLARASDRSKRCWSDTSEVGRPALRPQAPRDNGTAAALGRVRRGVRGGPALGGCIPNDPTDTTPGGRYIPAKVRRAVWLRDGGAGAFVSKSGRRCNERAFVQFHHLDPYGVGGEPTVENIQLRCRAHNAYEGELFYGHGRPMERRTLPGKSAPPRFARPDGDENRPEAATSRGHQLRAINLAGHKPVAMADLRELLTKLGFTDVRSALQSGNLVFRSKARSTSQVERLLESNAEKRLALQTDFFVRTAEQWKEVIANNPFRQEAERDPSHLVAPGPPVATGTPC